MIRIENLSIGYGRKVLLSGLEAEIPSGTLVAMVGCNGSGKSTLLRTMAGLQPSLAGDVLYDGKAVGSMSPKEKSQAIAVVNTEKIRIPGFRCRDLVALGRAPYTGWAGSLSRQDEEAVENALDLVGLGAFADRTMDTMSDGECQMVMIARAIAQDTSVILLDEPTAFLDYPNRRRTALLLKCLAEENGKTIIYSTHDLGLALKYSGLVLLVEPQGISLLSPGSDELVSGLDSVLGYANLKK